MQASQLTKWKSSWIQIAAPLVELFIICSLWGMRCVRPTEPGEGTSSLGALTILVLDVLTYSLIVYKAQVQKWYGKQMIQHVTPTKCSKQTNLGHFNCEFEGFATSHREPKVYQPVTRKRGGRSRRTNLGSCCGWMKFGTSSCRL